MVQKFLKTAAVTAALAIASVTAASAATTITTNESYITTGGVVLPTNGSYQYDYQALTDLSIANFALSAVGDSDDITQLQAGFVPNNGANTVLVAFFAGSNVPGGGLLSGLTLSAGDTFSILFEVIAGGSLSKAVGVQVSFDTTPPAPVPVPAAGVMLISALGAAGFAVRRKKKNA